MCTDQVRVHYHNMNWMLTASLWVSAWCADTLVLLRGGGQVHAEVAHVAELRVVEEDEPPIADCLQRGEVQLLQLRVHCYHQTVLICGTVQCAH